MRRVKIREYTAPITVLAAGILGFSLICLVSAAALSNSGAATVEELEPKEIVNSAFSKPISTAAALTAVEITAYIATPTWTLQSTSTAIPSATSTSRTFITWTPTQSSQHRERDTATPTRIPPTNTPNPTNTRIPPTLTFTPTPTNTPVPTATSIPTDTPVPTATPLPTDIPTATPVPIDTPVPTITAMPLPTEIVTQASDINPSPGP